MVANACVSSLPIFSSLSILGSQDRVRLYFLLQVCTGRDSFGKKNRWGIWGQLRARPHFQEWVSGLSKAGYLNVV